MGNGGVVSSKAGRSNVSGGYHCSSLQIVSRYDCEVYLSSGR